MFDQYICQRSGRVEGCISEIYLIHKKTAKLIGYVNNVVKLDSIGNLIHQAQSKSLHEKYDSVLYFVLFLNKLHISL